jgi:hypothetical protein
MSMKNSNDTIGNRSRDLPSCSTVPQPLRHRVPLNCLIVMNDSLQHAQQTVNHILSRDPKYCVVQCDQKVSVHLMITIQKIISNVQRVPHECTWLNLTALQPTARARGTLDSH